MVAAAAATHITITIPPAATPTPLLPLSLLWSCYSFGQPIRAPFEHPTVFLDSSCSCTSMLCATVCCPRCHPTPAPVPAVGVPPFVWAACLCTGPHLHFVPPFVHLCRCLFVLVLIGACLVSLVLVWLLFALICLSVLVHAYLHLFGLRCL